MGQSLTQRKYSSLSLTVDPVDHMIVLFFTRKEPWDGTLHHEVRKAVYGKDYLGPKRDWLSH